MYKILVFICFALILGGCSKGADTLLGEYATEQNGASEIRVTKVNGKYYGAVYFQNKWDEVEMRLATDKESKEIIGNAWATIGKVALISDKGFYIAKVEPNSSAGTVHFKTGYFALLGFIPAELYKK